LPEHFRFAPADSGRGCRVHDSLQCRLCPTIESVVFEACARNPQSSIRPWYRFGSFAVDIRNDMRAKLGNGVAVRAYREGTLPFSDGTIIARLAWNQATSEENNNPVRAVLERGLGPDAAQKVLAESFVAGAPTNVQFMIKDSRKYASNRWLRVRSIHRRQTCRRVGPQNLLSVPRTD
jgi:hypothetical protein